MPEYCAECYFLDVGQGTSQVIYLGNGTAIVIDCGASYLVLGDLLRRRLKVQRIAALILSHNHSDHIGGAIGASGLISEYRRSIDEIFVLQDQSAAKIVNTNFFFVSERGASEGKHSCTKYFDS